MQLYSHFNPLHIKQAKAKTRVGRALRSALPFTLDNQAPVDSLLEEREMRCREMESDIEERKARLESLHERIKREVKGKEDTIKGEIKMILEERAKERVAYEEEIDYLKKQIVKLKDEKDEVEERLNNIILEKEELTSKQRSKKKALKESVREVVLEAKRSLENIKSPVRK